VKVPPGCSYYEGLQKCLGLVTDGNVYTSEQVKKLVELYNDLRIKYPRSAAAKVRLQILCMGDIHASIFHLGDMEIVT